jgi:hypothetical protein
LSFTSRTCHLIRATLVALALIVTAAHAGDDADAADRAERAATRAEAAADRSEAAAVRVEQAIERLERILTALAEQHAAPAAR